MKKLTVGYIKSLKPCSEGLVWFKKQNEREPIKVLNKLMAENHHDWANWLVVRLLKTHKDKVKYALNAARSALPIYEKKYPGDNRIRLCIEATDGWLQGKVSIEMVRESRDAAAYAADAAYAAAADYAVAAAYADYAADAAYADYAADAAADTTAQTLVKLIQYGIKLLR